jgi:hypothetical protein
MVANETIDLVTKYPEPISEDSSTMGPDFFAACDTGCVKNYYSKLRLPVQPGLQQSVATNSRGEQLVTETVSLISTGRNDARKAREAVAL